MAKKKRRVRRSSLPSTGGGYAISGEMAADGLRRYIIEDETRQSLSSIKSKQRAIKRSEDRLRGIKRPSTKRAKKRNPGGSPPKPASGVFTAEAGSEDDDTSG